MASSSSSSSPSSSTSEYVVLDPSPSSSTSEYLREPGSSMVYTSASTPFLPEKQCRPFRIVLPPSMQQQQQQKRKRPLLDGEARGFPATETNRFREPLVVDTPGSSFGPSGKLKAKPPKPYTNSEALLAALATSCIEDPEVDFSGSYMVVETPENTLSDKQRVQAVNHDIWRVTGYRFTVKDHPPSDRGHKTRLWCSQDEARRSKHRGTGDIPRLSKQGELFAKQRFPCRSRLMISCLPEGPHGTRVVTVRMHHYMRHDSYLEAEAATAPPFAPAPVPSPLLTSQFFKVITKPLPPHLVGRLDGPPPPPPPALHEQEGEWELARQPEPDPSPSPSPHIAAAPSPLYAPPPIDPQQYRPHGPPQHTPHPHPHPPPHPPQHAHPPPPTPRLSAAPPQLPPPHAPQHTPPGLPPGSLSTAADFERRLRTHIARIRDVCDGLEYQVQFHDHRMLEELERDAAPFFAFVDNCLRMEGRHDNPAQ